MDAEGHSRLWEGAGLWISVVLALLQLWGATVPLLQGIQTEPAVPRVSVPHGHTDPQSGLS